jgi:GT2 family glycosyltransferase
VKLLARPRIVVLGMMTPMPVAGVVWQTVHYLIGLRRLGYDVTYVEAHARTPSAFVKPGDSFGVHGAAAFLNHHLGRFGFGDRWAYQALHSDGESLGMTEGEVSRAYDRAALILNLHGGTIPRHGHDPERLVYLETDPVLTQLELYHRQETTARFLASHFAHFTFGENFGSPDCQVPVAGAFRFRPTRQPVVLDLWRTDPVERRHRSKVTTVAAWRQWRDIRYRGELYRWSKHEQFEKVLDLPGARPASDKLSALPRGRRLPGEPAESFELALSGIDAVDRQRLEVAGWAVRDAEPLSADPDAYREYIRGSRAEFTVAKDQNVRLRSGWFSDRSATYLAAGCPVITQDTGFGRTLPTGRGLFAFETLDDARAAVDAVRSDYEGHARAAEEIAAEYFDAGLVLGRLLDEAGVATASPRGRPRLTQLDSFSRELVIQPISRHPTRLPEESVRVVLDRPLPGSRDALIPPGDEPSVLPRASVIVVTHNGLLFTRLCLESLLANTSVSDYELIVVDNASTDDTPAYLRALDRAHPQVRIRLSNRNAGFAAACNVGLEMARGVALVLLNNDTIPSRWWLGGLLRHLGDPSVGAVGAVTNRICNEAQIETEYRTYGELMRFSGERRGSHEGERRELPTLTMFCFAMRRGTWEQIGSLDERFGVGTLEDDDYSLRIRRAGLQLACAEDVFVHHFDKGSFGQLVGSGDYDRILRENRLLFEEKWGEPPPTYLRRPDPAYEDLRTRLHELVGRSVPAEETVLVASRGDDSLVELPTCRGRHFPEGTGGAYAGHYPATALDAIGHLEELRREGASYLLFPAISLWWLDHYEALADRLRTHARVIADVPGTGILYGLPESLTEDSMVSSAADGFGGRRS